MARSKILVALLISTLAAALSTACGEASEATEHGGAIGDGWLGRLPSDAERLQALEDYLGGFSSAMWEVGERYRRVFEALEHQNYALADYHWDKLGGAIENGYMKRPARRANADALFLDEAWGSARAAFASGDAEEAWAAFEAAREACMACHVAEEVPFMNDQPIFNDLRRP